MNSLAKPAFPLTVSTELWEAFAETFSPEFADSWLWGARVIGDKLLPRTRTGYRKLNDVCFQSKRKNGQSSAGGKVMADFKLTLMEPPLFQDSGQKSAMEILPDLYFDAPRKRSAA